MEREGKKKIKLNNNNKNNYDGRAEVLLELKPVAAAASVAPPTEVESPPLLTELPHPGIFDICRIT
ncbi:hypothetical protein Mgra_00002532 [Meloidogyne graminicola]|uniref:Uncharacterized protein n=1 Tax=Meloidogyne graminicola TaxID=189291 RepID=A0A8S9ZY74_9BILA|nr:hypothetical protein Mgra_00002532 [Meloidogyne graminicola]